MKDTGRFEGWPPSAVAFFEGLEEDNSKTYWLAHKAVYDQDVRAPMVALLAELEDEFGPARIFRPYRDTRFSPDKTPYKTSVSARIGYGFVSLTARGLQAGTGLHQMSADQLDRYRAAVAADGTGAALERIVGQLAAAGIEVRGWDELKTAPSGYPKDHPRIALLRYKGITAGQFWPVPEWLGTPEPKARVADFLRVAAPLDDWLARNVGAAAEADDTRHRR